MKGPRIKLDPSEAMTMDRISDALRPLGLHATDLHITSEVDPYGIKVEIRAWYQPNVF